MVKTKANVSKVVKTKVKKAVVSNNISLDEPAVCWAKLLQDPCNAPICESPYSGQKGYTTRVSGTLSLPVGAGNTALTLIVVPTGCFVATFSGITGATTFTPAFASGQFPGNTFLSSNSNQVRCLAGCIQAWSSLAPLNITGNVHAGVVPTSAVNTAGVSVDRLSQLATASGKLTAEMMELKWRPAAHDEDYNSIGAGNYDDSDRNAMFMAFSGLQSSETIQFKLTFVYEWVPRFDLGLGQAPTKTVMTRFRVPNILAALDKHYPNWWHNSVRALGNVATGFAMRAVTNMAKRAPLLLTA